MSQDVAQLSGGDLLTYKKNLFLALAQDPDRLDLRAELRRIVKTQDFKGLAPFVQRLEDVYATEQQQFLERAAMGWQYSWAMDGEYIDPTLEKIKQSSDKAFSSLEDTDQTAASYLGQILEEADMQARWALVQDIAAAENSVLLGDDSSDDVKSVFSGDKLNVLIVGAGCVGLTLANALKMGLGDKVNILVFENRVRAPHVKHPYSRDWLTQLPLFLFSGVIDDDVVKIFEGFGSDGYIGVPLYIYETCLFLSCKKYGVNFLFQEDADFSFLERAPPGLAFDASGGGFRIDRPNPYPDSTRSRFVEKRGFGAECVAYGVSRVVDIQDVWVEMRPEEDRHAPFVNDGQRIKQAMFKITHIPPELYEPLVEFVLQDNADAFTYVWPGTLRENFNHVLLLTNLTKPAYEVLAPDLPEKKSLAAFLLENEEALSKLDQRLRKIVNFLQESGADLSAVMIEPPFLYVPHVSFPSRPLTRMYGWPLLQIGDSLFNGNPKAGNGLSFHLWFVRYLHDNIINLFGRS